jgi:hypothetical protein
MSKNVVEPERSQMTVWRYVACWISKARSAQAHACARSHSTTYRLLIGFPRQQWIRERPSVLHYTYIVCPVCPNQVFINKRFDLFLMPFIRHLLIDGLFFTNVKMSGWLLNINWK